jgi:Asp-tRNA(Asn)/Glu-tRNA(Gln) amidotransferase A subunit family amidase
MTRTRRTLGTVSVIGLLQLSVTSAPTPRDVGLAFPDDPKISINAPLCLQLVAPRWEDERLMAALREVDAVVNGVEAK